MTIPGPNATDRERAELAMAFAERFIAFWDSVPIGLGARLNAVAHLVAELVIHASGPKHSYVGEGAEDVTGLKTYEQWRNIIVHAFPGEIGLYHDVEPCDLISGELEFDQQPGLGDAVDDLTDIMLAIENALRVRDEAGSEIAHTELREAYCIHLGLHHVGPLIRYLEYEKRRAK